MKKAFLYTILIFCILPALAIIYLSLVTRWSYPALFNDVFTYSNWSAVFSSTSGILQSLLLSIFISSSLSLSATVLGFLISRYIALYKPSLLSLAYYPYLIAPVVLGAMMQFYLIRMGLSGSIGGVMLAQFFFILPYSILLFSSFWSEGIRSFIFQASTLGASDLRIIRTVLVPLSRSWIALSLVQCFLISWFEYGMTRLIGVGKVETLTVNMLKYIEEANPYMAAVAGCLMIIPVLFLFLINYRLVSRRELL